MERLETLYKENDFPGISKLYKLAKKEGLKITYKDAREVVAKNKVSQLHKRPPKKSNHPITSPGVNIEFQMDLLDMNKFYTQNSHYRYILIVVDIFTRRAFATPLKNKSAETTLVGLKKAFEALGEPKIIASDNGSEFKGAVSKYLEQKKIIHKMNEVGDHNVLGIIDRFSQTIKNTIYKHFTDDNNTKWIDKLDKIVENYNNSPHGSLDNMTPTEAKKYESDTLKVHAKRVKKLTNPDKLKVGDIVRVLKKKTTFERGFNRKYSLKTYKITRKEGFNYILDNDKKYREHMLQKVPNEDKEERQIDQVKKAHKEYEREKYLKREGIDEKAIIPTPTPEARPKRNRKQTEFFRY